MGEGVQGVFRFAQYSNGLYKEGICRMNYKLIDEETGKTIFVGTEFECLEYSKKHPDKTFIFEQIK